MTYTEQPAQSTLPDPPVREDGSCFVCGQPRVRRGVKALYAAAAANDPFCSTACARAWHGCTIPSGVARRVTSKD
jgi:hypothetical protein